MTTLRIAWRNVGRNKKRSLFAFGAIAIGQAAFLATAGLMHGYADQFMRSVTGPLVGHIQVHRAGWRDERSLDLALQGLAGTLEEVRALPNVAHASARVFAPVLGAVGEEGFVAVVVGIDPEAEAHEAGLLPGWQGLLGHKRVLVGRGLAKQQNLREGTELALVGQDVDGSIASDLFVVEAIIPSPVDLVDSQGIVMSLADAQEMFGLLDAGHEVLIHVTNTDLIAETVRQIEGLGLGPDVEVLPWDSIVPHFVAMVRLVDAYALVVLSIVCLAAVAGIANTMLMSTFERTHEFGMLLSLGCTPRRLAWMVTLEALLLGLLGVAGGSALGGGFVWVTSRTGMDYAALGGTQASYDVAYQGLRLSSLVWPRLHFRDLVAAVVAVGATTMLAVLWPLSRLRRLEPVEALRS